MKIADSAVSLASQHASVERHSVRESLRFWTGNQRPDFEGRGPARMPPGAVVRISDAARAAQAGETRAVDQASDAADNDPKLQLLIHMIEAYTGRKVRLFDASELSLGTAPPQLASPSAPSAAPAPARPAGWGLEYDRQETHVEAEQTDFAASGVVRTADGREVVFDLQLSMSREYVEESSVSLRAGDAVRKDPLVINFSGTAAQLTDTKFAFDIDRDGAQDSVSFVAPGSGFLALDRNGNGGIDDGGELFGAQSGDGFAELAAYDQDGNHWIDEADAVYADLRVWSRDAAGHDSLATLAQKNVGALYLGSVATPFELNIPADNTNLGAVRASGVYLAEDGGAGTLQQVDLTV